MDEGTLRSSYWLIPPFVYNQRVVQSYRRRLDRLSFWAFLDTGDWGSRQIANYDNTQNIRLMPVEIT